MRTPNFFLLFLLSSAYAFIYWSDKEKIEKENSLSSFIDYSVSLSEHIQDALKSAVWNSLGEASLRSPLLSEMERTNSFQKKDLFQVSYSSNETAYNNAHISQQPRRFMADDTKSLDSDDMYLLYFKENFQDNYIRNIYLREHQIRSGLQARHNVSEKFDQTYTIVPASLVYTQEFKNKTYRIVKLPSLCEGQAQKLISQAFWYICDGSSVYVELYLTMSAMSHYHCNKVPYYLEVCVCPVDRFGVLCNEQTDVTCQFVEGKKAVHHSKQLDETREFSESYEKPLHNIQSFDGTNLNLKITITCQNSLSIHHKLNKRFKVIKGMCMDQGVNCELKPFSYFHADAARGIMLSDQLGIHVEMLINNWNHFSTPYQLQHYFPSIESEILTADQPIFFKLNLDKNEFNITAKNDVIIFGRLWYTITISAIFKPNVLTKFSKVVLKQSGILQDDNYAEPKAVSIFQLMLKHKVVVSLLFTLVITIICVVARISQRKSKNITLLQALNPWKNKNSYRTFNDLITEEHILPQY